MSSALTGLAIPLDEAGLEEATNRLKVGAAELWAVLAVETEGCGFLPDRRPYILFERHIFSNETNHRYDASDPDISNPLAGGYGAGGIHQYERLHRAIELDRRAALRSTSWGIGQLMGFNAEMAGYADVEEMVSAMTASEAQQLLGMVGEITHNKLDRPLRNHDWASFAHGYNGPAYAKNRYDSKLEDAYEKFSKGSLPDLVVRAAQLYLTYLGYKPGPVDGIMGQRTLASLNKLQTNHGLPVTENVDKDLLSIIKRQVEMIPD
jgi:hypothetical protein